MFLLMGVNLYTSRVVLQLLGFSNFGLYNLVGSIVILFGFINFALTGSTQRFINYELGKIGGGNPSLVFSMAFWAHFVIAVIIVILAETIGFWFINTHVNIPDGRVGTMNVVYQLAVANTFILVMRAPFSACIIAHEKMSFYAYAGICEALLKLALVGMLFFLPFGDKLEIYSAMIMVSAGVLSLVYWGYCRRFCQDCRLIQAWNPKIYFGIMKFSGWNLLGSASNVVAQQGMGIVLNIFYGVCMNAAMGVVNQVVSSVYGFVSNFQTAFDPQIVKSYAAEEKEKFKKLIFCSSKFSYYLLLFVVFPFSLESHYVLKLWLVDVPEYSVSFCVLMLIFMLVEAISSPFWVAVQSTGNIRNYQIIMAVIILLNLPFIYFVLRLGFLPESVFVVRIIINLLAYIAKIFYMKRIVDFNIWTYICQVPLVALAVTLSSLPLPIYVHSLCQDDWIGFILTCCACVVSTLIAVWCLGMNKTERRWVLLFFSTKFKKS